MGIECSTKKVEFEHEKRGATAKRVDSHANGNKVSNRIIPSTFKISV